MAGGLEPPSVEGPAVLAHLVSPLKVLRDRCEARRVTRERHTCVPDRVAEGIVQGCVPPLVVSSQVSLCAVVRAVTAALEATRLVIARRFRVPPSSYACAIGASGKNVGSAEPGRSSTPKTRARRGPGRCPGRPFGESEHIKAYDSRGECCRKAASVRDGTSAAKRRAGVTSLTLVRTWV